MTTLTFPWVHYFNPKNFSAYTMEALSTATEAGVLTHEFAVFQDMAYTSIINHLLSEPKVTAGKIEKYDAALCVKLLMIMYTPHLLLRGYESFLSNVVYEPANSKHTGLKSVGNGASVTSRHSNEHHFEQFSKDELHDCAKAIYRLLQRPNTSAHKCSLGLGKMCYSPDLRNRFAALKNLAHARNYKLYFITVDLSAKENANLLGSPNSRYLEQKVTRLLSKVLGSADFAGTVVIEHSPASTEEFHLHMVIATRIIDQEIEMQIREQLRRSLSSKMKSAINIKTNRRIRRLKRFDEVNVNSKDHFIKQELPGIDVGVMDYLSKDLSSDLKIGRHSQVFSLNNDLFYKKSVSSILIEFQAFLIERARKLIQIDNKESAMHQLKECILTLILNLRTKIFKQNMRINYAT